MRLQLQVDIHDEFEDSQDFSVICDKIEPVPANAGQTPDTVALISVDPHNGRSETQRLTFPLRNIWRVYPIITSHAHP